jgi:hypothetical protein
MSERDRAWLGASVYVQHDGYQIELHTHDGLRKTGIVYLDPQALQNFLRWLDMTRNQRS